MTEYQFYYNNKPKIGELVLVQFTTKEDSFFKAKLIEYNCEGIMNFQDATKKKKIKNWNSLITLNKNMVARVDDIYDKIINQEQVNSSLVVQLESTCALPTQELLASPIVVQLSIAYLNDNYKSPNLKTDNIQNNLLLYFNENKLLEKFIKSFCINELSNNNNYDFYYIWYSIIHSIDKIKNEENNVESLWKYFINNFNKIKPINEELYFKLKDFYEKKYSNLNQKKISRIGIVSLNGIQEIKNILNIILPKLNFNYEFKYDSTPYYLFSSNQQLSTIINDNNDNNNINDINDINDNIDDHNIFIKLLENEIINKNIFIKIDYLEKII
jgi:hypothetical protein